MHEAYQFLKETYVDDVIACQDMIAMAKLITAAIVAFNHGAKNNTLKVRQKEWSFLASYSATQAIVAFDQAAKKTL
jgi:hypothetical protein